MRELTDCADTDNVRRRDRGDGEIFYKLLKIFRLYILNITKLRSEMRRSAMDEASQQRHLVHI